MTADCSHDKKIKPEGHPSNQAELPLDVLRVAETHPIPSNASIIIIIFLLIIIIIITLFSDDFHIAIKNLLININQKNKF